MGKFGPLNSPLDRARGIRDGILFIVGRGFRRPIIKAFDAGIVFKRIRRRERSECFNIRFQAKRHEALFRCRRSSLLFTLPFHSNPLFAASLCIYIYIFFIDSLPLFSSYISNARQIITLTIFLIGIRLKLRFNPKVYILRWPERSGAAGRPACLPPSIRRILLCETATGKCSGCLIVRLLYRISCPQCRTEIVLEFEHDVGVVTIVKKHGSKLKISVKVEACFHRIGSFSTISFLPTTVNTPIIICSVGEIFQSLEIALFLFKRCFFLSLDREGGGRRVD